MAFKTTTEWGRKISADEADTRILKLDEMVAAGVTDGTLHLQATINYTGTTSPSVNVSPSTDIVNRGIRYWTTEAAANEWVAFLNTFSPAPVSNTVEAV